LVPLDRTTLAHVRNERRRVLRLILAHEDHALERDASQPHVGHGVAGNDCFDAVGREHGANERRFRLVVARGNPHGALVRHLANVWHEPALGYYRAMRRLFATACVLAASAAAASAASAATRT